MQAEPDRTCADPAGQDLERIVADAVEQVLTRLPRERRAAAMRQLREELERCLTETPLRGDAVDAMDLRMRLAAAFARSG